jgi:N-acetylmuramoyl-L-alanine amidase
LPATTTAEAPPPAAGPPSAAEETARPAARPEPSAARAEVEMTPIASPPRPRPTPPPTLAVVNEAVVNEAVVEETALASLPPPGATGPVPTLSPPDLSPPEAPEAAAATAADPQADSAVPDAETVVAVAPIAPAPPLRPRIIALDPGHGGVDPGTIGINGVLEKEVTLDLAERLRRLIEATGRYDVMLTREEDVFVSLRDRIEAARRADAALFISIHADSLGDDSQVRGASVYTLSDEASDGEAARLARKENRADIIAGTDLSTHDQTVASILIDLAQRVTNNKSIEFADVLTGELAAVTALVKNTRRFAGFVVLKSPDVPSVLLELGYLSNPTDAANLARPEYRDKLARATLRAIDRYFAGIDVTL